MSYTNLIFHAVFTTKHRAPVISVDKERRVYGLLHAIMQKNNVKAIRIGGIEDHVHILFCMPPTMALSDFMKTLKRESSFLMGQERIIDRWPGWQEGYSAFSYSRHDVGKITNYIKNQKEHHKRVSFVEELRDWLIENGVPYDERFFPK